MEELTPELERRLQVEEAWARRIVLSDMLNERRLASYETRRMLLRFHTADFSAESIAAPGKSFAPRWDSPVPKKIVLDCLAAEEPEAENKPARRMLYWIGATAAAGLVLLAIGTASGAISWASLAAAYGPKAPMEAEGQTPAEVLAASDASMGPAPVTKPSAREENIDPAQQPIPSQVSEGERPDLREEVRLRIQAAREAADHPQQAGQQAQTVAEAAAASMSPQN